MRRSTASSVPRDDAPMRMFLGFLVAIVAVGIGVYLYSGLKLQKYSVDEGTATICSNGTTQISFPPKSRCPSGYTLTPTFGPTDYIGQRHRKASWQNAVAVLIAVAGVGAGAAIVLRR
jgi:hypothetical protein